MYYQNPILFFFSCGVVIIFIKMSGGRKSLSIFFYGKLFGELFGKNKKKEKGGFGVLKNENGILSLIITCLFICL